MGTQVASHHGNSIHKKRVLNRLSRANGHLSATQRMADERRDCEEILIQLLAVRAALNNLGKLILKEHMEHCIPDALSEGDEAEIRKLQEAIKAFIRP